MQTFQDSATLKYCQYNDDVVLDIPAGSWSTPPGAKGTCPTTLIPYTGTWPIPPTLAEAQATQSTLITSGCQAAIVGGFTSSALGTTHFYPSDPISQGNQQSAALSSTGGSLWVNEGTTTAPNWVLTAHTQAEAQAVVGSFVSWLNSCQSQLVTLKGNVAAATTVAAVQAVVWVNP